MSGKNNGKPQAHIRDADERKEDDKVSDIYNFCMMILIVLWMVPLWFKEKMKHRQRVPMLHVLS